MIEVDLGGWSGDGNYILEVGGGLDFGKKAQMEGQTLALIKIKVKALRMRLKLIFQSICHGITVFGFG